MIHLSLCIDNKFPEIEEKRTNSAFARPIDLRGDVLESMLLETVGRYTYKTMRQFLHKGAVFNDR